MQRRELEGFDEYFIADDGSIYHNNRKLKTTLDKDGYVQIGITVNRKTKTMKVHRLVAKAFISNPNDLKEVNHIDGDKQNNSVGNLEWCSHAENLAHASANKLFRYGEQHQNSKLSQQNANEIRKLHSEGNFTQKELAKKFGTTPMVVNRIVRGMTYIETELCNE